MFSCQIEQEDRRRIEETKEAERKRATEDIEQWKEAKLHEENERLPVTEPQKGMHSIILLTKQRPVSIGCVYVQSDRTYTHSTHIHYYKFVI